MGYRIVKVRMPRGVWLTPDELAKVTADTVKNQTARRWDAQGAADGSKPWEPHTPFTKSLGYANNVLSQTRMLRNATVGNRPEVSVSGKVVTVEFSSPIRTASGYNLGAIHQRGVAKEILPINAGALFLPKLHPGIKTKAGKRKPPPGGFQRSRRSVRVRIGSVLTLGGKVIKSGFAHFGQKAKGVGSGASPTLVSLQKNRDFVLLDKVPLKPYAGGMYSIPPRPIFQMTEQNREELKERMVEAYKRKAAG